MAYHPYARTNPSGGSRALLESAGLVYLAHVGVGGRAETVDRMARELGVDEIVIGTARRNSFTRLIEDSVTSKALDLTQMPVRVVAGSAVSSVERAVTPVLFAATAWIAYSAVA